MGLGMMQGSTINWAALEPTVVPEVVYLAPDLLQSASRSHRARRGELGPRTGRGCEVSVDTDALCLSGLGLAGKASGSLFQCVEAP